MRTKFCEVKKQKEVKFMKAKKVYIRLELTTALPVKTLKNKNWWTLGMVDSEGPPDPELSVDQVQVNVIQPSD
jgi:hypothetical protein